VRLGRLADLVILDTRLVGRDRPAAERRPVVGVRRRDRSLLGPAQWKWLEETLGNRESTAGRWTLLASQVVMAPIHLLAAGGAVGRRLGAVGGGLIVNSGQWDGYPDERERLLALIGRHPGEALVLSGDLHSSWVSELRPSDGAGPPVAAEFTVPAVSAPTFARVIRRANSQVAWVDTAGHGYVLLDVTPERIESQWWHVERVGKRTDRERLAATWSVARGDPRPIGGD